MKIKSITHINYMREYQQLPRSKKYRKKYRETHKKQAKEYRIAHKEYQCKWRNEHRFKKRLELLNKLGNKCVRCGFSDWRALQIDKISGGHRKELKVKFNNDKDTYLGRLLKLSVTDLSAEYQLLCSNCNNIKKYENGEYGRKTTHYIALIKRTEQKNKEASNLSSSAAQNEALEGVLSQI